MTKIHGLAMDHRTSHNNPGNPAPVTPDAYAYRTTLCGQVRYAKSDFAGGWVWQDGRLMAVDANDLRVTCLTCRKLRFGVNHA